MNIRTGFRVFKNFMKDGYSLAYVKSDHTGLSNAVGMKDGQLLMEEIEESNQMNEILFVDMEQAQSLYVALGEALSKDRCLPQDGQFEAQSKHLEDMKTIAFRLLKIN